MPSDDAINLSLLLPLDWWHRLHRIAETCHTSPCEFVREAVEAEVVRRELLLERRGEIEAQWLAFLSTQNISQLQ